MNPTYFPEPHAFKPERYLKGEGFSDEEVETAKSSYWVFSLGPRKCPGIKMAYMELYLTLGRLIYLFDMKPEKPQELEGNYQMLDHFSKYDAIVVIKIFLLS
jgi:cytochrome P450